MAKEQVQKPDNRITCLEVKLRPWEHSYFYDPKGHDVKLDDWVIVASDMGEEVGKVIGLGKVEPSKLEDGLDPIKKVANLEDLKKIKKQQTDRKEAVKLCKQLIRKFELPMKLVDCVFTFDEKKLVFAFTAESRVDFRDLVKELINHFQKSVRLQQIGIRDELKQVGGIGPCGRKVCCSSFLDDLGNITTDLARLQQVQQRGSDRLSGACGRLKCCLAYEATGYREFSQKLPPLDSKVKTDQGEGKVIEWNVIKHSVLVRIDRETIVEKFYGCRASNCAGCKANKYFEKQ